MSNKLITVRKGYPGNLFYNGDPAAKWRSLAAQLYTNNFGIDFSALSPEVLLQEINSYMNSTGNNWFGISKINNPLSRGNIGNTMKAAAPMAISAGGTMLDGWLNKGAHNAVGDTFNTLSGVAAAIPGLGLAASAALKGAGIVANGFTNKTNYAAMNAKKAEFSNYAQQSVDATDSTSLSDAYGQRRYLDVGKASDYTSKGFLASGAKKRKNFLEIKDTATVAEDTFEGNLLNAATNINKNRTMGLFKKLTALGGPLEGVDPSTAIGYELFNRYLGKDKATSNSSIMAGVAGNTLSSGGKKDKAVKSALNIIQRSLAGPIHAIFGDPGNTGGYSGGTYNGAGVGGRWGGPEYFYNEIYAPDTLLVPVLETFNEAFARARRQGLDTFDFNGRTYTTEMSDNPNWRQAGDARVSEGLAPLIIPADTIRRRSDTPKEDVYHPSRFNMRALGGNILTGGGTFPTGLTHIDVGGTHEENPNDGVQVGVDQQGTPNLVEEGEVIFGDYVFSNRLRVPNFKEEYKKEGKKSAPYEALVLWKYSDNTFAEAAKKIEKATGANERPSDSIAQDGMETTLEILAQVLEKEREKDKLQEMQDAIDEMSPEEFAMLQEQMLAGQLLQLAEEAAMQQLMMLQQMVPLGMEQMLPIEQQQPIAALGGILNRADNQFAYGGTLEDFQEELKEMGLTLDDYLLYLYNTGVLKDEGWKDQTLREASLNEFNFDKDLAELYLKAANKKLKEVARLYRKNGKNPSKLTGSAQLMFLRDVAAAMNNPELLQKDEQKQLFVNLVGKGDNKAFSIAANDATVNETRQRFFGNPIAVLDNGKFAPNYGLPEGTTPQSYDLIKDMWKYDDVNDLWLDSEGKVVANPFNDSSKFLFINNGTNGEFKDLNELNLYYLNAIADRFLKLKGNDYLADKLPNYYLTKELLEDWIGDLENSTDSKNQALAKMLRNNWNLDADKLVESDAYLGLNEVKNNRLQRDAKPGIEHVPYINTLSPTASRFQLIDAEGKPLEGQYINYTGEFGKNDNPLYSINWETPLGTQGGVTTYGVRAGELNPNIAVVNGEYYYIDPEKAQQFEQYKVKPEDASKYPGFDAAVSGYSINPTYYNLPPEALAQANLGTLSTEPTTRGGEGTGGKTRTRTGTGLDDTFPKMPTWPYWMAGALQLGSLGYNLLAPKDYSNANAMLAAAANTGKYTPIGAMFAGLQLPYKPAPDTLWGKIQALTQGNARNIINNSNGNIGATTAGLLSNTYNGNIALGDAHEKWRQGNWGMLKDAQTFGLQRDTSNYDRQLKADMANQDAENRAKWYSLEGTKAGLAMRQAIDDARASAINAGISGLANLGIAGALQKYNNDVISWQLAHNQYPISQMESGRYTLKPGYKFDLSTNSIYQVAKGGKLKRKKNKGLSF